MTITAGTKVGRYEICSKIGEGGMGEVYRGRDENRYVAMKVRVKRRIVQTEKRPERGHD